MPLVLTLLIYHSLLLWIDLQLHTINLTFCVFPVYLVMHSEERYDRDDIGQNEVKTLTELEEA